MAIITGVSMVMYCVAVLMFFLEIKAFVNSFSKNPISLHTLSNGIIVMLDFGIMGIIGKANGLMGGIPTIAGPPSALASVLASIWMYRNRKQFERHLKEAEEREANKKGVFKTIKILRSAYKKTKTGETTPD